MDKRQGSAIVEMAVMLPVLIIMFIGMIEFGLMISAKREMGVVANQVAGVLYNLRSQDVTDGHVIDAVLKEAQTLGGKNQLDQITVRFCEWRDSSALFRNYKKTTPSTAISSNPNGSKCDTDQFKCNGGNVTQLKGHGAFVQVTTCQTFHPLVFSTLFNAFGVDMAVYNTSHIPLSETNQTQLLTSIANFGGLEQESGSCPTSICGTPDEPTEPTDPSDPTDPGKQCPITNCPTGQKLVGEGADCACQKANFCLGATLNETSNRCETPDRGCPSTGEFQYLQDKGMCSYTPRCRDEVAVCAGGTKCTVYTCDACAPGSSFIGSEERCYATPLCPDGYEYSQTTRNCTKPNAP